MTDTHGPHVDILAHNDSPEHCKSQFNVRDCLANAPDLLQWVTQYYQEDFLMLKGLNTRWMELPL